MTRRSADVEAEIDAMSNDGRLVDLAERLATEAGIDWPRLTGVQQDAWGERAIEHVRARQSERRRSRRTR